MSGLLYNPLFAGSMGLLAAGGPSPFPVGFGQALNRGLLQAQNADVTGQELGFRGREADQRDTLFQLKQQAAQQEAEQQARQQAAMARLGGTLSPQQQAMIAAGIPAEKVLSMPGGLLAGPASAPTTKEVTEMDASGNPMTVTYQWNGADWERFNPNAAAPVGLLGPAALSQALQRARAGATNVTVGGEPALETRPVTSAEAELFGIPPEQINQFVIEKGVLRSRAESKLDATTAGFEGRIAVLDRELATATESYTNAISRYLANPLDPVAKVAATNAAAQLKLAKAARANFQGEPGEGVQKGFDIPGPTESFLMDFFTGKNPADALAPQPDVIDLTGVK